MKRRPKPRSSDTNVGSVLSEVANEFEPHNQVISFEAALYAIRSAQSDDALFAVEILDPFLAGESVEGLLSAINRLNKAFRMEGGDRTQTNDALHYLKLAITFDSANSAKPRSIDWHIALVLASYVLEWEEKRKAAAAGLKKKPKNKWAVQWMKAKRNKKKWEYAWSRARSHEEVGKRWKSIRGLTRGYPRDFYRWKKTVTDNARAIVSGTKSDNEYKRRRETLRVAFGTHFDPSSL